MFEALNASSTRMSLRVRYAETDQMGVVNHARYFDWFAEGRVAWLEARNQKYSEWEKNGWVLPVIDAQCKYRKSILFQEDIELVTTPLQFSPRKVVFGYQLFAVHKQDLLAEATTTHLFMFQGKTQKLDPELYEVFSSTYVGGCQ